MRKRAKETATILKMAARADAIMSASTATLPIHVQPFRVRLRQRRRPALQRLQRRAQRRHPRRLFSRLDAVRPARHRADGSTAYPRRRQRPASARRPAAAVSLAGVADAGEDTQYYRQRDAEQG